MTKTDPGIGKPERPDADTDPGPPPSGSEPAEPGRIGVRELLDTPLGRMPMRMIERASSEGLSAVQYQGDAHHPPRPRLDHVTIPNAKVLLNVTQPNIAAAGPPHLPPEEPQQAPAAAAHEPQVLKSLPTVPRIEHVDTGRVPMRSRAWLVGAIGFALAVSLAVLFKLTHGAPSSGELPSVVSTGGAVSVLPAIPSAALAASATATATSVPAVPASFTASTAQSPVGSNIPSAARTARALASASAKTSEPTHLPPPVPSSPPSTSSAVPSSTPPPVPSNVPSGTSQVNQ